MKVFGIPVKIDPSFLLVGVFLASRRISSPILLIEWLVVIFVSIIVHELGHAFTGRAYGLQPRILLHSMGGLTSWTERKKVSPQQSILISLAGPAAGFLFGGAIFLIDNLLPDLFGTRFGQVTYHDLLWVNWGWGALNLLPVLPLDGGNAAASLEEIITKKKQALFTRVLSLVLAAGLALWALSTGWLWAAFLMALFAVNNGVTLFQFVQHRRDQPLLPKLGQAREAIKNKDGSKAVQLAQEALDQARSGWIKEESWKMLARGCILENDLVRAREVLDRLLAIYGPEAANEVFLAFAMDEWPRFLPLIESAYKSTLSRDLGMILSQALAEAGRFEEAMTIIADPRQAEFAAGLYAVLQEVAFDRGQYDISIEAGRLALERGPNPQIAYNIGCAYARMDRIDEALEWINRAVESGFNQSETLVSDPDVNALRSRPEFELICQRLREAKA